MHDKIKIDTVTYTSDGRRIFYIDTGNVPPKKAEEYIKKLMSERKVHTLGIKE